MCDPYSFDAYLFLWSLCSRISAVTSSVDFSGLLYVNPAAWGGEKLGPRTNVAPPLIFAWF